MPTCPQSLPIHPKVFPIHPRTLIDLPKALHCLFNLIIHRWQSKLSFNPVQVLILQPIVIQFNFHPKRFYISSKRVSTIYIYIYPIWVPNLLVFILIVFSFLIYSLIALNYDISWYTECSRFIFRKEKIYCFQ